ncbi:hypothetical protein [Desertivirga xinjiangensis]|uniref:hypothetical protein n=1 Tax=Desertivirga xinjiangensis TaxID=539206 RepID=UPI00210A876D|nr:hypothetical protein [Pedobacter xinjiangensis]
MRRGETYVSKIEDSSQQNIYPADEWANLAEALGCQIHDLLPPDGAIKSDGTKVEKRVINFSNEPDVRLVMEGLIEADYFKECKSAETLFRYLKLGNEEEANTVRSILNILVSEKILIRTEEGYQAKQ